jgi:parallel beta-helix repeat protein
VQRLRLGLAMSASVSLVLLTTVFVSPAAAGHITCGQTITTSVVFDTDVGPCSEGITVGAHDIVIDLNGHRLFGTPNPGEGPGIFSGGRRNVRIQNGTITQFDSGVSIESGATGNVVTGMFIHDNIGFPSGAGDYGEGIQIFLANANHIVNNTVIHNGTFAGIVAYSSRDNLIENNYVMENNIVQVDVREPHHPPFVQQDIGIWIVSLAFGRPAVVRPSTGNIVRTNHVSRNGLDGIQISRFSTGNVVDRNNVQSNGVGQVGTTREGDGIAIFGDNNFVVGNSAIANAADGIAVERSRNPLTGEIFPGGVNNQFRNNRSFNNGTGANPDVNFDLSDDHPGCDNNIWAANIFGTRNQPCIT